MACEQFTSRLNVIRYSQLNSLIKAGTPPPPEYLLKKKNGPSELFEGGKLSTVVDCKHVLEIFYVGLYRSKMLLFPCILQI